MRQLILLSGLIALSTPVLAQTFTPAPPSSQPLPSAPPSSAPPERIAPSAGNLSQQNSTITPPNVDPGMTVAPTQTGRSAMPVIPPPGSAGGNQAVVPK